MSPLEIPQAGSTFFALALELTATLFRAGSYLEHISYQKQKPSLAEQSHSVQPDAHTRDV